MNVNYPVDQWDPPLCGEMDLRIDKRGDWYHNGTPIRRRSLIQLFASIMRREPDGVHYLLTPVEKWAITVEDTPFRIIDFRRHAGDWVFISDVGDEVVLNANHPLRVGSEPAPTILVRHNMEARLGRNVFYHLVNLAHTHTTDEGQRLLLLKSGTQEFSLGSF